MKSAIHIGHVSNHSERVVPTAAFQLLLVEVQMLARASQRDFEILLQHNLKKDLFAVEVYSQGLKKEFGGTADSFAGAIHNCIITLSTYRRLLTDESAKQQPKKEPPPGTKGGERPGRKGAARKRGSRVLQG